LRFIEQYGIPPYDADQLTQTRATAHYFEEAARICGDPKAVSNWMMGDLARLLNANNLDIADCKVTPAHTAGLVVLINDGTISGKMAKSLFEKMFETGEDPRKLAEAEGPQISNESAISEIIDQVIFEQRPAWDAYVEGDEKKKGFFVGQVMKVSQGKANPAEVNRLIDERLSQQRG
jgi:aspartyl-tRNA(Asn)/glutamyl-tRNA(Gln) amidotransferase subunit B